MGILGNNDCMWLASRDAYGIAVHGGNGGRKTLEWTLKLNCDGLRLN